MKDKIIPIILFTFLAMVSCKNDTKGAYDPVTNTDTEYLPPEADIDPEKSEDENDLIGGSKSIKSEESSDGSKTEKTSKSSEISGTYIKVGEESDKNCGCYCLDMDSVSGSELCLVKDEMFINTRFEKTRDNTFNVFLIGPSKRNKQNEIPFEKFDTNTPIATISPLPNGELQLNWLGFKSDGDLMTDYAIYGKKALEETYRRK